MKIEKTKKGYTTRVYDSSKKKQIRITAPTKRELKQKINDFVLLKREPTRMTLKSAIAEYIELKAPVLSASTIRGYKSMLTRFEPYNNLILTNITDALAQEMISSWSKELSPKSVRNHYSLLKGALKLQGINVSATLPKRLKSSLNTPSDSDIKSLLEYFKDTEMETILLLAIYVPMRRGEICALNYEDIKDGKVSITKSMVYTGNSYIIKNSPKTFAGYRTVELPEVILNKIGTGTGRIFSLNVDNVSHHFSRAVKKLGIQHIRFHDLRHYAASYFHSLGIPDKYIIKRGGWENEAFMKRIYQGTIEEREKEFNREINNSIVL